MDEPTASRWQQRAVTLPVESARQRALAQSVKFVQAALELLSQPGRSDLTVTEVVERAGVSLRTFYQRFGGKDEFMLAVLEESLLHGRGLTEDAMGDEQDPVERLRIAVTGMLAPVSPRARNRRAALAREHLRLAQLYPEEIQQLGEPAIELLTLEIARGAESGAIRRDDPRRLAVMVHHLISAHTVAALLETLDLTRAPVDGNDIWEFVRRALQPD
jgi:AcrR family transcriptional regulator